MIFAERLFDVVFAAASSSVGSHRTGVRPGVRWLNAHDMCIISIFIPTRTIPYDKFAYLANIHHVDRRRCAY